jgi:hypothetical protein
VGATEVRPDFERLRFKDGRPAADSEEEVALATQVFDYYRESGWPYRALSASEIGSEFGRLASTPSCLRDDRRVIQSMIGLSITNNFHERRMIRVPCRNFRTPMEVFEDDDLLMEAIVKRIRYGDNLLPWGIKKSISSMRRTQRVSSYRPTIAKSLCQFYDRGEVLDFSMGWGGRMLGTMAAGRGYVGIDPEPETVDSNRRMMEAVDPSANVSLIQGCAEDVLPGIESSSFGLIHSSPPYFDVERYSDAPWQSWVKFPTRESWVEGFLRPVIAHSARILAGGGVLLLNVNPDMVADVEQIAADEGLGCDDPWMMPLSQHQFNKASSGLYRYEPIMVLTKKG